MSWIFEGRETNKEEGGNDTVEALGDKFRRAIADEVVGLASGVGLVDLGVEVDAGDVWYADNEVCDGGRETGVGNEVMDCG